MVDSTVKLEPASKTSRQNNVEKFSPNFLVTIFSSVHGGVVARLPEELQFQLSSEWDTPLLQGGGVGGILESLVQEGFGVSTKTQFASAQVWSGSSPIEITLPLEFYAENNPRLEVIDPIIKLAKMALPRKSGGNGASERGLFVPPGPRIFGFNTQNIQNDQITIDIGNFLNFKKVVIVSVNPVFKTRDMLASGEPLSVTCEVVFRSMFSLTGEDFESMFKT